MEKDVIYINVVTKRFGNVLLPLVIRQGICWSTKLVGYDSSTGEVTTKKVWHNAPWYGVYIQGDPNYLLHYRSLLINDDMSAKENCGRFIERLKKHRILSKNQNKTIEAWISTNTSKKHANL